jgi:hypothetical protein
MPGSFVTLGATISCLVSLVGATLLLIEVWPAFGFLVLLLRFVAAPLPFGVSLVLGLVASRAVRNLKASPSPEARRRLLALESALLLAPVAVVGAIAYGLKRAAPLTVGAYAEFDQRVRQKFR